MTPQTKSAIESFFAAFAPPPKLSLSEWADQNAFLSSESSAESGRWRTLPYQKEILDAFTDPKIEEIWIMKSARVGFTKMLNNAIGYYISHDPCPILVVQPTIEDAEGYSKEEIAPMLRDTPCLEGKVADAKVKDSTNTISTKIFPGGLLSIIGANSGRGFRRVSRRVVFLDEIDAYPISAGADGDPIRLAIKRSEYYWDRKIGGGSTPLIKDSSRIERLFENTNKQKYFVPCPQCGHFDYLVFFEKKDKDGHHGHFMKWPEDKPEEAFFVCSKNACIIEHKDKRTMVEKGQWRPTSEERFTGSGRRRVGFHIWAAYSYSPNASWGALAQEFLEAKKDPEEFKTFVNTVLGETWEENYSNKVGAEGLMGRREFYEPNRCPQQVLILTAGVDIQDNRIEVSIYGWAEHEENWVISHDVIFGDPSRPEIYKQLDSIIFKKYQREHGGELPIHAVALDTGGHHTHEVYQYVRERRGAKVFVIGTKGQSQRGKVALGKPTTVDINFRGQVLKNGAQVYPMGSDTIKNLIFNRLKNSQPGPGYTHFHTELGPEFFEQLTSEKKVTRMVKGQVQADWVLKKAGMRNEALDCAVLAYAALQFLYTKFHRATIWKQFGARAQPAKQDQSHPEPIENNTEIEEIKAEETEIKFKQERNRQPQRPITMLRPNRRGGFIGRF